MKAFITGSQIYGTPTPESDLDIVIRGDYEFKEELIDLLDTKLPIKVGNVNLIIAETDEEYMAWFLGKKMCVDAVNKMGRRLTKDESIELHDDAREVYGVKYRGGSSG